MAMVVVVTSMLLVLSFFTSSHQHREHESFNPDKAELDHARFPPRGWNSYDSFSWTISEDEFLENAQLVAKHLKPFGYQYVVVDYLWYRRKVEGAYTDSLGFDVIDEWGRVQPDPARWSSSKGGKGFTEVAKKVHDMGLKFGIHVMRGISTQAVNANTPILDLVNGHAYEESGKTPRARDIGLKERVCAWMPHGFMSVDLNTGAGATFLRSLYTQYAEWGVDFVKHDCVFGEDFSLPEITFVSEVLKELHWPILYSLSPGTSVTPAMAKQVSGLVNMYRITGDDWDRWEDVASHFDISRDMAVAGMIGTNGLRGKSWPDLDMLPLGWLTDAGSNEGPHRFSNLSLSEKRTQMTLWSMAKSPLMFGGDMRKLDPKTLELITNPTLLEINSFGSNYREFPYVSQFKRSKDHRSNTSADSTPPIPTGIRSWIATGRSGEIYIAFFNLRDKRTVILTHLDDLDKVLQGRNIKAGSCNCREVWSGQNLGTLRRSLGKAVDPHGCVLFVLTCH
ncbi:unnamed protein product [Rhodiola kirilowii]